MTTLTGQGGRANQKARTRAAIVDACRDLVRSGAEVTMPEVARRALVSEATAYRYFPDLISLLREALAGAWPDPAEALAPVAEVRRPGRAGRLRLRVPAPRGARLPGRGPRDDRRTRSPRPPTRRTAPASGSA